MAGIGKRLRPQTLATPKPLIKLAGKPIVQWIIENFIKSTGKIVDEIHFVIGNFGKETEESLLAVAESLGAHGKIHYQKEALGTAHAVYCAEEALRDEVCIVFADTLYYGNIEIKKKDEAILWTFRVKEPDNYGVVVSNEEGIIEDFVEKSKVYVSDQAIVGMYYFREGEILKKSIEKLIKEGRKKGGEYQITDSLKDLKESGIVFKSKILEHWLDFGNKEEFIKSVKKVLELEGITADEKHESNKIINPVYIGKNVIINNSTIGANVIIEDNCKIVHSVISDSVIGSDTEIENSNLINSLIGRCDKIKGVRGNLNLGDYNEIDSK